MFNWCCGDVVCTTPIDEGLKLVQFAEGRGACPRDPLILLLVFLEIQWLYQRLR